MSDINNQHNLFQLNPSTRDISNEEILDDIKRIAESLSPKQITYGDYKKFGRVSIGTVERRFGSWNNALSTVGLKARNYRVSKEKLFENLEQIWISLGKQPTREEMRKPLSFL